MKKLLGVIFLSFLCCNVVFAKCIEGNCYDGQGTFTYESGNKYLGEFENGLRHGQGTFIFKSGAKYVGEFKNGNMHGEATYTFKSGSKYVGEFKNGDMQGRGTLIFKSGNKYVGEFKNGKRNGQGTYTYKSGEKYVGEFKNGKRNGQGTYYLANGDIDKSGFWENNILVKSHSQDVKEKINNEENKKIAEGKRKQENADSIKYSYDKDFVCIQDVGNGTIFIGSSKSGWATEINNLESLCSIFVYKDYHSKKYKEITDEFPYLLRTDISRKIPHPEQAIKWWKLENKKFSKVRHQKISSKQKTQTALQPEQKLDTSTTAQGNTTNYKVIFRKLDTIYKDNDKIYVVLDYWGTKAIGIANNHCSSMGKRTFVTEEYRKRYKKHFKNKGYKIKGNVAEYLCSKTKLTRATNKSLTPGFKVIEVSDEQPNNQTTSSSQQVDINFNISEKRQQCEAIGFTPNSEKFADCVLRLVELDMKNQQSNNMMTSQKKSQSDQFMSNALINLGQQLMQPNSSVNNSRTRNCSVRKSFGNTSTVTCY